MGSQSVPPQPTLPVWEKPTRCRRSFFRSSVDPSIECRGYVFVRGRSRADGRIRNELTVVARMLTFGRAIAFMGVTLPISCAYVVPRAKMDRCLCRSTRPSAS